MVSIVGPSSNDPSLSGLSSSIFSISSFTDYPIPNDSLSIYDFSQEYHINQAEIKENPPDIKEEMVTFLQQTVKNFRDNIFSHISEKASTTELQQFINDNYSCLLGATCQMVERILKDKGLDCPTEFAMGGLGSMAREEISPFSDLDFCIFVKEDNAEVRNYFSEYMTEFNQLLVRLNDHGFMLCKGELTPPFFQRFIEKGSWQQMPKAVGTPQLLNTPNEMIKHFIKSEENNDPSAAPSGASKQMIEQSLAHVGHLYGSEELVQEYRGLQARALKEPISDANETLGKNKALETLQFASTWQSQLKSLNEDLSKRVDIKRGALRHIQQLVLGLCQFYGITESNISKAIHILIENKHMHPSLGKRIEESYQFLINLRLKAQITANKEIDHVSTKPNFETYVLNKEEISQLKQEATFISKLNQKRLEFLEANGESETFMKPYRRSLIFS